MQKVSFKPHELPYQISEQIKYIRANIQFCGDEKKVILFTSTTASEGKSSLTLELAMSMAELGKRVLLVDADLRRSTLKSKVANREAVRLGLSAALTTLLAAESTGAQAGIGMRIRSLANSFDSPPMLMYIILLGIIGLILVKIVDIIERKLTGWQEKI